MLITYFLGGEWTFYGITFFIELFVSELLFLMTQRKKKHFIFRLAGVAVIFFLMFLFFPPFIQNTFPSLKENLVAIYSYDTFYFIIIFVISFLAMMLAFDESIWNILFCCVAGYCVQHAVFLIYDVFVIAINGTGIWKNEFFRFFVEMLLNIPFYFLFAHRLTKADCINVGSKDIVLFSLSAVIINIILSLWELYDTRTTTTIVFEELYSIACSILILFLQFSVFLKYKI
ncbi:MAG: hypothetical protein WCR67_01240 [Bacilli bacterium]